MKLIIARVDMINDPDMRFKETEATFRVVSNLVLGSTWVEIAHHFRIRYGQLVREAEERLGLNTYTVGGHQLVIDDAIYLGVNGGVVWFLPVHVARAIIREVENRALSSSDRALNVEG